MDKSKKRPVGRPKTPARGRAASKSPNKNARKPARSKSRGRPRKDAAKSPKERAGSRSRSVESNRSKSPGRPKSPAPRKSPGRQRARAKSPARPSTRSRSRPRTKKSPVVEQDKTVKEMNLVLKDVMVESITNDIIRRSLSRDISVDKNLRRSSRISSHVKDVEKELKKMDGFAKTKAKLTAISPGVASEFGGWPGAVLSTLLVPALILALHLACTKDQCTLSWFHVPRNWRVYFNLEAAEIVVGFVLLQTLLSALPIGRRVGGPPGRNGTIVYRCNGLLCAILNVAIVAGLWYLKFPVSIVYERLIPLLVSAAILGPILGLLLYIKGGRAPVPGLNPYGVSGNRIYDYFVGREVNPLLFNRINIKNVLFRTATIGGLLMCGLIALRGYEATHTVSYPALAYLAMYLIMIVDVFWFEDSFAYTFESMYEGTGAHMAQTTLLYPFFACLGMKYIVQHKVTLPVYHLALCAFVFLVGFVIYRASNLQKATFRKNPLDPALAHFQTISTARGKKLLVGGWWGWVRHPNYFGDILIQWALAATVGCANVLPYSLALLTTLYLAHRAKRDGDRCKDRYMSAWDEYCERVRYRIVPRVY